MPILDINSVTSLFNHYHDSVKSKPNLYKSHEGGISVVLPEELCWEWSNRAGGDSGGTNPRPIGIRYYKNSVENRWGDQSAALEEIFSSIESLYDFILESDCEGAEHLANKIAKKQNTGSIRLNNKKFKIRVTDDRPADVAFGDILKRVNINDLVKQFGKEDLMRSRKCLTVNEFELRYGI
tara:strand:- start:25 stop:567 length:543 start_codon:yes stop_codon:yes gene_type:complete